jgi:hypothetical protein
MAMLNLEVYEALREAKVSEDSARKAATAIAEASRNGGGVELTDIKADMRVLKGDVAELKSDMKMVKADVADLKADVKVLKVDMAAVKASLLLGHWMVGFVLAAVMAVLWKLVR